MVKSSIHSPSIETAGSGFINHSQGHSSSFSAKICEFESNATSDWLNHMNRENCEEQDEESAFKKSL